LEVLGFANLFLRNFKNGCICLKVKPFQKFANF
jgi:hypothetical protein